MQVFRKGPGRAPLARCGRRASGYWRAWLGVVLLALLASGPATAQAPRLVSARYWFDSNARATMTAADGAFDAALETAIAAAGAGLSAGPHVLHVEMLGEDGQWGPATASAVVVLAGVNRPVRVQSGEVQIDNGTVVAVTAADGAFDQALEQVVKTGLAAGAIGNHSIRIRLKDADGQPGPWFTSAFAVVGTSVRAVRVQSGEVQIDAGTAVAVTALDGGFDQAVEQVVKSGLAAGAAGAHSVRIRLKDAGGQPGPWFTSAFSVVSTAFRTVRVQSGEVQIDNGAAVAVTALDGAFDQALEQVIKGGLAAGAVGAHRVRIRLKDHGGQFGPWVTSAYSVVSTAFRTVRVQSARYWFDGGSRTTLAALDGSFDSALETAVATSGSTLTPGPHTLHVELQDQDGQWGPTFSAAVVILTPADRLVSVQSGEVWWDNEPNHTALVVMNGQTGAAVGTATAALGTMTLAPGPHGLNLRMRGQDGQWGNTVRMAVLIRPCTPAPTAPVVTATPNPVFLGQSVTLAVSNPGTGLTYSWTGPGLTSTTGTSVTATPASTGTATYSVVALTAANCPSPAATVSVTVNPGAPAPTLSGFTPGSGGAGATVVLTGTNLTGATSVTIGGVAATFTVNSATQITVTVPVGAVSGPISVTTPGGTAATTGSFTVIPAPAITSFTPTSGAVGAGVTLTGAHFTGATSVKFNGTPAAVLTVVSATTITTNVPAGATSGLLTVTTPGGTATSGSTFYVAPTISSFSPASAAVGATVTLNGSNLNGATGVSFNGVAASYTVLSNTAIAAVVPATATTGKVSVVTPGGTALSVASFKVVPTISGFSPALGTPHAPGTVVTITGTGLLGATAVKFYTGACPAGTFTVVNSTTITATVPATATTGKLYVTTPGGTATSAASFGVAPTISSFTPGAGSPGSVVIVTGLNFTSGTGTSVRFNGTSATTVYQSVTQVTATVPAGATTGPLTVTTANGTHTSAGSYTITTGAPPTITSFSPTANVIKGTVVTITGTRFTGATAVRFNNVNTTAITVLSDTQVQAAVPTGAVTGKVYAITPTGMAQSASNLTIIQPPTVTSFSPASGSPGSVVLLGGTNLTGASAVTLNGQAVSYTVNSAAQIVVTVPAGATTGKFSVTTIAGTGTSAGTFTVTSAPAPSITALSPGSGPRGSTVVVTGTNFTGVTSVKVNTAVVAATAYTVDSPTQITLLVPATATTGRVYVTAAGGMAQSPASFTVILPPTLTSFSPASAAVGATVTVNGTNLTGATSVTFGGVAASSYTVVSPVKITAVVPAGAVTGHIAVTTVAGTATKGTFTVLVPRAAAGMTRGPVDVTLFPNPATEWVGVEVKNQPAEMVAVELLDALGRVVREARLTEGYVRLPVGGLPPGIYVVRVAGQLRRLMVE